VDSARQELAKVEQQLRETVQLRAVVIRLDEFAARVRSGLDKAPWHERRHIVRTLVAKVEIDDSGATVVYRLPAAHGAAPPSSTGSANAEGGDNADPPAAPNSKSCHLRGRRDLAAAGEPLLSTFRARLAA